MAEQHPASTDPAYATFKRVFTRLCRDPSGRIMNHGDGYSPRRVWHTSLSLGTTLLKASLEAGPLGEVESRPRVLESPERSSGAGLQGALPYARGRREIELELRMPRPPRESLLLGIRYVLTPDETIMQVSRAHVELADHEAELRKIAYFRDHLFAERGDTMWAVTLATAASIEALPAWFQTLPPEAAEAAS